MCTFLKSLQITITIFKTKVQHSDLPDEGALSPYAVVTGCRKKASIKESN